jgi:hypothetical protein
MCRITVTNTCKHDNYHMWNFYILPSLELWKDNISEGGGNIILTFSWLCWDVDFYII